jgi:hypothetical protein
MQPTKTEMPTTIVDYLKGRSTQCYHSAYGKDIEQLASF